MRLTKKAEKMRRENTQSTVSYVFGTLFGGTSWNPPDGYEAAYQAGWDDEEEEN